MAESLTCSFVGNLQDLKVSVLIRRTTFIMGAQEEDNKWDHTISWQEKRYSPHDLLRFSQKLDKPNFGNVERDYYNDIQMRLDEGEPIFEDVEDVVVYTVIDRDLDDSKSPSITTSAHESHLAESMNAIHLSDKDAKSKGIGSTKSRELVLRENRYMTFKIGMAVDIDREQLRNREPNTRFQMIPLCSIVCDLEQAQSLILSPGDAFQVFVNQEDIWKPLITAKGTEFEYRISINGPSGAHSKEDLKKLIQDEWKHESRIVAKRVRQCPTTGAPMEGFKKTLCHCEIMIGEEFRNRRICLTTELQERGVSLQDGFRSSTPSCRPSERKNTKGELVWHFNSMLDWTWLQPLNQNVLRPQLLFHAWSVDSWGRVRNEGVGYLMLPSNEDNIALREYKVRLWRPKGTIRQQLSEYLIGSSMVLNHASLAGVPTDHPENASVLSRHGMTTTSSGVLTVRISTIGILPESHSVESVKGISKEERQRNETLLSHAKKMRATIDQKLKRAQELKKPRSERALPLSSLDESSTMNTSYSSAALPTIPEDFTNAFNEEVENDRARNRDRQRRGSNSSTHAFEPSVDDELAEAQSKPSLTKPSTSSKLSNASSVLARLKAKRALLAGKTKSGSTEKDGSGKTETGRSTGTADMRAKLAKLKSMSSNPSGGSREQVRSSNPSGSGTSSRPRLRRLNEDGKPPRQDSNPTDSGRALPTLAPLRRPPQTSGSDRLNSNNPFGSSKTDDEPLMSNSESKDSFF
eukprot:TRINITY_DN3522_c0_g2_i1.p1 TRINITY_DN3522_c0_g2~~TRINITY_DN3522_c0_g2_i1.p1  ORF type:complete len:749 (+),score=179.99 TRINITY_DN3522_c0_g2_i1:73-2319(+)